MVNRQSLITNLSELPAHQFLRMKLVLPILYRVVLRVALSRGLSPLSQVVPPFQSQAVPLSQGVAPPSQRSAPPSQRSAPPCPSRGLARGPRVFPPSTPLCLVRASLQPPNTVLPSVDTNIAYSKMMVNLRIMCTFLTRDPRRYLHL
jgi:hypothetical protein